MAISCSDSNTTETCLEKCLPRRCFITTLLFMIRMLFYFKQLEAIKNICLDISGAKICFQIFTDTIFFIYASHSNQCLRWKGETQNLDGLMCQSHVIIYSSIIFERKNKTKRGLLEVGKFSFTVKIYIYIFSLICPYFFHFNLIQHRHICFLNLWKADNPFFFKKI